MKAVVWADLAEDARRAVLARPSGRIDPALQREVRAIVEDVRADGWEAAARHAERLDGATPRRAPIAPIAADARRMLTGEQLDALTLAHANVTRFHAGVKPVDHVVETMPGLRIRQVWRPLDRVGLYVPGGSAPLFSTLMMLAIPAAIAGVSDVTVVTPPRGDGGVDPVVALAAELCGIDAVWTIGGAQAIAALAWGAGAIAPVRKIFGPGNAWVAEAKRRVAAMPGGPAIDLPAGPSELMVIADGAAEPRTVAADLLSQAEHDATAQVMLVTDSAAIAAAVATEADARVASLPRRETAEAALAQGRTILVRDLGVAVEVANAYAPEHLSLAVADPEPLVAGLRGCGAIFAGANAAETFGDYLAGPSHVLPTDGAARAWSGVSVRSFMTSLTVQDVSDAAARAIAGPAALLARLEGLEAHARAADARARCDA